MRPHLVSLALMLLCRSVSCEEIGWHYADGYAVRNMGSLSPFAIANETKVEQFKKFVSGSLKPPQFFGLYRTLGNTLYAMILDSLGKYETLPSYYKSALVNGVLCEVSIEESAIRNILYGAGALSVEQRATEEVAAKDPVTGIDCASPALDPCFCTQKKVLLYCAALKFKKNIERAGVAQKQMCEKELINHFTKLNSSSDRIAHIYYDDYYYNHYPKTFNATEIWYGHDERYRRVAELYCSASNPASATIVKTIFAANALRWTLEGVVWETAFGGEYSDIDSACEVEKFKESEVGRCACTKDKGLSFCIYKARGEHLKTDGYLSCEGGAAKFNEAKLPARIRPFACLSDSVAAATAAECAQ